MKTERKLLFKNLLFPISYALLFLFLLFFTGYRFSVPEGELLEGLPETLGGLFEAVVSAKNMIYIFLFLMLFAFEYLYRAKASETEECIRALSGGKMRMYKSQTLLLTFVVLLSTLLVIAFNIYGYYRWDIGHTQYIWSIIRTQFINIFLAGMLSISIGTLLAVFFKRAKGYFAILVISGFAVFAGSKAFNEAVSAVFTSAPEKIAAYADIFNIFVPNTDYYTVPQIGLSALPYRAYGILFWFFLVLALLGLTEFIRTVEKKKIITISVCAVLCFSFLLMYGRPASKFIFGSSRPDNSSNGDFNAGYAEKSQPAGFHITGYEMTFRFRESLTAKVKADIDKPALAEYTFTLWRSFHVSSVKDQNGKELKYERDGNYISVKGNGEITSVYFEYKGFAYRFMTNSQIVFLPGYFSYYPKPGYLINTKQGDRGPYFVNNQSEAEIPFKVIVDSRLPVFSNLSDQSSDTLTGTASSLTLTGGFMDEKTVMGVRVIYPYLDGQVRPLLTEQLVGAAIDRGYLKAGDVLICGPRLGQSEEEWVMRFNDGYCLSLLSRIDEPDLITEPVYY